MRISFFGFIITAALLSVGPLSCAPMITKTDPDFIEPLTSMEFVFIKGGVFKMGDPGTQNKRELPLHDVTLADLHVGMFEVTFAQYDEFCEATGQEKPSDEEWGRGNRPVTNVSWEDANAYAVWLSKETGLNFSLPSESQWEYFARSGSTKEYWTGRKLPTNRANCRDCGSQWDNRMTAPVGSFRPNPWGIYDTAGNVAEWTLDDFENNYNNAPNDGSPLRSTNSTRKALRGGAWSDRASHLKSSARDHGRTNRAHNDTGFRLILKLTE